TIPIPDMVLQRRDSEYRGDREQSARMMRQEIAKNRTLVEKRRQNLIKYIELHFDRYFGEAVSSTTSRKPDLASVIIPEKFKTSSRLRDNLQKQIRINRNILRRVEAETDINRSYELTNKKLLVEIYKKYSIPFACVVFVLIGAPLGIMARRGSMAVGGGISLLFFIIYWIFLIGGEELADRDMMSPFMSMWLANFVVGIFGLLLLIQTVKEVSINLDLINKLIPKKFKQ
ncbi:MAG TPA: LptF/LptG family permease, partial [bacterium]|nr:LptF/LptG family permease [bacterium]